MSRSALLWKLHTLGFIGGFKAYVKKKELNHTVPHAVSRNYILKESPFTFKLRLPLVEVEVCLWELEDEQVFSLVPITQMYFKYH